MKENKERKTLNQIVREKQGYRTTSVTEKNPQLSPITRKELMEMLEEDGWKLIPTHNPLKVGLLEEEENVEKFNSSWSFNYRNGDNQPFDLEVLDQEVLSEIILDKEYDRFSDLYPEIDILKFFDEYNLTMMYNTYEREDVIISFIMNSGNRNEDSTYHLVHLFDGTSPCNRNVFIQGEVYYYQKFIDQLHDKVEEENKRKELQYLEKRMSSLKEELN